MSARPVRVLVTNSLYVVGDEAGAQLLGNDGQKLNLTSKNGFIFNNI